MDAKTIASLPPKLLAQYLRDPSLQMAMQYQQEASDTSPVQHWTQGAARLVKGLLGGIQASGIQEQYGKQAQNAATERQMALASAIGRPAETQQVGDRTINWQAQQPNFMSAAANLQSPDNADLAEKFLGAQISQNQTAAQNQFAMQQQARGFEQAREMFGLQAQQQQAMNNALLDRQIAFERDKRANDPQMQLFRQFLNQGGQGSAPLPQDAIPATQTPGQSPAGIQLGMTQQEATAQPMQQAPQSGYDPRITSMAMTVGLKMPDGMGLDSTGKNFVPLPMAPKNIPAEQMARLALGDVYLTDSGDIRQKITELGSIGSLSGIGDRAQMAAGMGAPGELSLRVQSGADALQRNLTGAGMSNQEADKYIARYVPSPMDSQERLLYKHDQLVKELQSISSAVRGQYGQKPLEYAQPTAAPTNRVNVLSPDGVPHTIDASELQEALNKGWRQQ